MQAEQRYSPSGRGFPTVTGAVTRPTNASIDRAGHTLRLAQAGKVPDEASILAAEGILAQYRAAYYVPPQPIAWATVGLRAMCSTLNLDFELSTRLKRRATILAKLLRQPRMRLSQMRDIGGVRIVLADQASCDALHALCLEQWVPHVRATKDYVRRPQASGYRALHVELHQDGLPLEVQFRTQQQHAQHEASMLVARWLD